MRRAIAAMAIAGMLIGATPVVAQAQEPGHSGMVLCLRSGLVPEKAIDLPFVNFPGGPIPAETQVIGFFMSDDAQCPS